MSKGDSKAKHASRKSSPKASTSANTSAPAPISVSPKFAPQLEPLLVAVGSLVSDPANVRRHDDRNLDAIRGSLARFGQTKPIVVQDGTGIVIAGNGTLAAAKSLGWEQIAAVRVEFAGSEATAYAIADNRSAELATWDDAALAALLTNLQGEDAALFAAAGFTDDELARILADVESGSAGAGDGEDPGAGAPPVHPVSQRGELYELGPHRLMCGDSTQAGDVATLMAGEKAVLCWTDPPYGVSYVGKTKDALTIENDGAADLPELLAAAFSCMDSVALADGAAIYIAHPPGALCRHFINAFCEVAGPDGKPAWRFHQTLVWVKDALVLGHSDYHFRHEPMILGYKLGAGRRGRGGQGWYGDDSQTSIFEVAKPKTNADHPTMKPLELIEPMIRNSSPPGGIVFEPFGGSGSTLIACAQTGRQCRAMELSPAYCDVIRRRWTAFARSAGVEPGSGALDGEPESADVASDVSRVVA